MTVGHDRRLAKLEATLLLGGPRSLRRLTTDELVTRILDLSRMIAMDPAVDPAKRAEAAARVADIEDGIREQAADRAGPRHAERLDWLKRIGRVASGYVPALTPMGEGDSLDTPRLMARRAALWARPDVIALVGAVP